MTAQNPTHALAHSLYSQKTSFTQAEDSEYKKERKRIKTKKKEKNQDSENKNKKNREEQPGVQITTEWIFPMI